MTFFFAEFVTFISLADAITFPAMHLHGKRTPVAKPAFSANMRFLPIFIAAPVAYSPSIIYAAFSRRHDRRR